MGDTGFLNPETLQVFLLLSLSPTQISQTKSWGEAITVRVLGRPGHAWGPGRGHLGGKLGFLSVRLCRQGWTHPSMGSSWLLHKMGSLGISRDVGFLLALWAAVDGDAGTSFLNLLLSPGWMKLEGRYIYLCFIQVFALLTVLYV